MDARRTERVAESMREELVELISYEFGDPRLEAVAITLVRVDPQLRHADVLFTCAGGQDEEQAALAALKKAQPRLRRLLAERMTLHKMPEIRFAVDHQQHERERLEVLLARAAAWRRERERRGGGGA